MPDNIPLPRKKYSVIYADPPWAYSQGGNTKSSHGIAKQHYPTMATAEICALPVHEIVREGAACFMWATFPNITEAIKVMEAWGFAYKTAAFVWVKKNRRNGGNFMGMGAYTRANAEVCLLGVTPGFKAKTQIRAHNIHLRPLYYVSDADKQWYKDYYGIRYSDAYEVYGLKRTGCCGCAISARAASDLELIRPYEPNVVKAAWNIFGDSYRYRAQYNAYKTARAAMEKDRKKKREIEGTQGISLFDIVEGNTK